MKNALIVEPSRLFTPHLEAMLEILCSLKREGAHVSLLTCDALNHCCDWNIRSSRVRCLECQTLRQRGISTLTNSELFDCEIALSTCVDPVELDTGSIETIEDLKAWMYEDFDAGMGVASTLISMARNSEVDVDAQRVIMEKLLGRSVSIYRGLRTLVARGNVDEVYTFNGRFSQNRAVVRACEHAGVPYFTHERGANLRRYSLTPNALPHSILPAQKRMRAAWEAANPLTRESTGKEFFNARAGGVIESWFSFTAGQEEGRLPEGWDASKTNIVIFNSSEDEMAAIGDEWKNLLYANQREGIQKIMEDLQAVDHIDLYLRVHPNLRGTTASAELHCDFGPDQRLTLIPPEASISSYALLANADLVITFGSTIGIEAAYAGIPSVLAGRSFYENFDCVYTAHTHQQVIDWCVTVPPARPVESALVYGYYMKTFGVLFSHFQPTGVLNGKFKGGVLKAPFWIRMLLYFDLDSVRKQLDLVKRERAR